MSSRDKLLSPRDLVFKGISFIPIDLYIAIIRLRVFKLLIGL